MYGSHSDQWDQHTYLIYIVSESMEDISAEMPLPFAVVVDGGATRPAGASSRLRTRLNNIEYFPPNFEGLVLGCIDAGFCK